MPRLFSLLATVALMAGCDKHVTPAHTAAAVHTNITLDYFSKRWCDKLSPWLPHTIWATNEVRKNTAEQLEVWRQVASDPRHVWISETQEGLKTVTIVDSKQNSATLWLDRSNDVESVSGY